MGETDSKAFKAPWMKRLPQEADELTLVCSKLQQEIQNSEWYPFRNQVVDEKLMVWSFVDTVFGHVLRDQ